MRIDRIFQVFPGLVRHSWVFFATESVLLIFPKGRLQTFGACMCDLY